eukprot:TRINITY_DN55976_c0_g1_i1.p1 TRINITY_DN55976_c0_g1~~TRINITY_DN55976_c0_g1_i1.p1  ORF type:complete len:144 (-),score=25.94 TRINITY_DN55976_c0_g1_i1:167-598(-)
MRLAHRALRRLAPLCSDCRWVTTARPALPDDCSEEPTNCCGNNCDPCVWEVYHDKLKLYQARLRKWEQLSLDGPPGQVQLDGISPGSRAYMKNLRAASLVHMNGLLVDVLQRDSQSQKLERWLVRPVGGQRVLILPADKLEAQ